MTKKELVTRLVEINQIVDKLYDLSIELTGSVDYEDGITGEFCKVIELLNDIVLEDIPTDSLEYGEKIDKVYGTVWDEEMPVEEKVDRLMRLGERNQFIT